MGRDEISHDEGERKTTRAQKKGLMLKGDGQDGVWLRGGEGTRRTGKRAQMAGNTQQHQSVKGECSACEIDPPYQGGSYVRGVLAAPLGFIFQSGDESSPRRGPLPAAELFTCCHISAAYCTSQHFRGGSACSGLDVAGRQPKPLMSDECMRPARRVGTSRPLH